MEPKRSGVMDMFVVHLTDKPTVEQHIGNFATILTCTTYLIFDGRSMEQRSKTPVDIVMMGLEEDAINFCMQLANGYAARHDTQALKDLYNMLANKRCKEELRKAFSAKKEKKYDKKIEI